MTAFVVYDLEYTTWEGALARQWSGPGEFRELVQIGAVRLSSDFREVGCLSLVVLPRMNPQVSDYFIRLTGISQDRVDAGMDIAEALAALAAFAAPDAMLLSNGPDATVIAENCRLAGLDDPFLGRTRDVHAELVAASGHARSSSFELAHLFGIVDAGPDHDALADARNVAAALAKLAAEGRFRL